MGFDIKKSASQAISRESNKLVGKAVRATVKGIGNLIKKSAKKKK